jgi:hypothetical protein
LEGAFWFFPQPSQLCQPIFEQISALLARFSRQPADASSLCATALDQWLAPRPFANQLTAVTPYLLEYATLCVPCFLSSCYPIHPFEEAALAEANVDVASLAGHGAGAGGVNMFSVYCTSSNWGKLAPNLA